MAESKTKLMLFGRFFIDILNLSPFSIAMKNESADEEHAESKSQEADNKLYPQIGEHGSQLVEKCVTHPLNSYPGDNARDDQNQPRNGPHL